ncbi:MAG: hypothetical protein KAI53_01910 [Candidatus Aenigmarchaeota archaeon]|nr:hypothetical protein [Candidatus Aenigmarchaeota archaeon]
MIANTNGRYSFEILTIGDYTKLTEEIQGAVDIICDGKFVRKIGLGDFESYLKTINNDNITHFILNGTFTVPKDAIFCEASGYIGGKNYNRTGKCKENCFCQFLFFASSNTVKSGKKEVWTREEFLMSKWVDELKTSNEEQRKQNQLSVWVTLFVAIIAILGGGYATYYAQKKLYEKKIQREYNEKIWAPINSSILFCLSQLTDFLKIYSDHNSWRQEKLENNYDYWVGIKNSPNSIIVKHDNPVLYNKLDTFFEKLVPKYNYFHTEATKESSKVLLEFISLKLKKPVNRFLDTDPSVIMAASLKEKTPKEVYAQVQHMSERITDYTKRITLSKNDLIRIKAKLITLDKVKKILSDYKHIVKEANEIEAELKKRLDSK